MYKILGSDGHEYGPLSTEKIKQWISEERVEKNTPVLPDGAADWVFLSSLPEFAEAFKSAQKKSGTADSGKKWRWRTVIWMGLILLAVLTVAVIWVLKHAKHH
ncbi:MAG: GYF domain-containing protein [Verrucomicrobiia bacterium]|jgi:flagellar biosynthesis/type III secretory pathway M-ring protein FliF/YscJ